MLSGFALKPAFCQTNNYVDIYACSGPGGACYNTSLGYTEGGYYFGSCDLQVYGQCDSGATPSADESAGWAFCSTSTISGGADAWAAYATTIVHGHYGGHDTSFDTGYVISDAAVYWGDYGAGPVTAWEGWDIAYCSGPSVSSEPPFIIGC
jgi:hypothetical protein